MLSYSGRVNAQWNEGKREGGRGIDRGGKEGGRVGGDGGIHPFACVRGSRACKKGTKELADKNMGKFMRYLWRGF